MADDKKRTLVIQKILNRQKLLLENMTSSLESRLPKWRDQTVKLLSEFLVHEELEDFSNVNTNSWREDKTAYLELLTEIDIQISNNPLDIISEDVLPQKAKKANGKMSRKVFVIHGHDALIMTEVARTLEKIGLEAIILHEQPNEGKTIIEKFERDASQVSMAVAILTPDDIGFPKGKDKDAKGRARQNVLLELGYFSGILGRKNVVVLHKNGVEIPSDYLGVVYINIDASGAWKFELAKEIKGIGLAVDLNDLV